MFNSNNSSQINKLILQVLQDGDEYGLEIIKKIEKLTNGKTIVKQPSLYSALSRMEKKGLITSFWRDSEIGGRRHYYSLTDTGKRELKKEPVITSNEEIATVVQKPESKPMRPYVPETPKTIDIEKNNELLQQTPEPIIKSKTVYEQFDPNKTGNFTKQSFTQQMREYIEPEDLEELTQPSFAKINQQVEKLEQTQSVEQKEQIQSFKDEPEIEFIQEHKTSKDDINYKDILGDLDADLSVTESENETTIKENFIQQTQITQPEKKPQPRKQSEFSKQIAEILRSDKKVENTEKKSVNDLYSEQNKNMMEEISRRYNLGNSPAPRTEQVHKIATNTVGYTHIKQDSITVKPYSKTDTYTSETKNFLDKNKFNLCRAGIMTIIFFIELIVSYFLLRDAGMIYEPHVFLYILYGVLGFVYLGVMMMLTLKDLNKKTRLKDINWGLNLLYRLMFAIVAATFVIAVCLCLGMTAPLDIEFFTLWYIPALGIVDLLLSWVVGIILYATKSFRV